MKLIEKLRFPKIKINYRLLLKYFIIALMIVCIGFGINFLIQKNRNNYIKHDVFKGNIENLYYYLKKEPQNMELFGVLKKGDSVAVSVWENYISTSDDLIKKFEKQIMTDLITGKHFPEKVLYEPLGKALNQFKIISLQNQERIEAKKSFNQEKLIQNKKELTEMLNQIAKSSKKVGLDLR